MLALLKTRRWVVFSLVVLVSIVAFGVLSGWQWQRAEARAAQAAAMASGVGGDPIAMVTGAAPGGPLQLSPWQQVTVSGRYRADQQVLVRNRPQETRAGFWVVTPLVTPSGVAWVNRGWMATTSAAAAVVTGPPPPSGEVVVTGQWLAGDTDGWVDPEQLPAGQVTSMDIGALTARAGLGRSLQGYVVLTGSAPAQQDLARIIPPSPNASQNVSYAIQWIIFAIIALVGWGYLLRREHREELAGQANCVRYRSA